MRKFIYLDNDMVNSIIAQEEKGLIDTITNEEQISESEQSSKTTKSSIDATIGANVLKIAKAEADFMIGSERTKGIDSLSVTREMATKTLHDAAFDIAVKHIKDKSISDIDKVEIGSYISLSRDFQFIDFEYFEGLFNEGSLLDFLKKFSENSIREKLTEETNSTLNRDQQRKNSSSIKQLINDKVNESNQQYDDTKSVISLLKSIVPYKRMLVSEDGLVIPLEDIYFRDNPDTIAFKYGGKIKCDGFVTKIVTPSIDTKVEKNTFTEIQDKISAAMLNIIPNKSKQQIIVQPLAIYYEI